MKNSTKFAQKSMYQISLGEDLLRDLSRRAEIENDKVVLNGNIFFKVTADKEHFSHTITSFENTVVFLGQEELLQIRLYYWEDYLMHLKTEWGWLVCLKAALDIYSGSLKGLYGVPYITDARETALMKKLKELVVEGVGELIKYFHGNKNNLNQNSDYEKDNNAIKISIEFCHVINAFDYLFSVIFYEFEKEGYEYKFIENLEPFILSGYFKDELIPNNVLKKICDYYFEQRKYHVLERVVSKLNFSCYEYIDVLEAVWTMKNLTTTLIHLIISSNQTGSDSWTKILAGMFKLFSSIKNHIDLEEIKHLHK